ncbi:MAG: DNA-binding protein [Propionibacteriaceae bacterium]|nr:DNA-binding protein [Propionibacteriaceae bacterium]
MSHDVSLDRFVYVPGVSDVGDIDLDEEIIHDQHGQRITEAVLDQEAEQMARQYPGLRPGGKSLSGDGSHSPVLRLVVSKETRDKVDAAAEQANMSVSKWLRRVIEEKLVA